ncbi:hypothetical protein HMPREF0578_0377 [Mobiluncus mulieris 28-1]|nr:hypothetical protein HMPREF0578_0377 [Mobiluncus mulieris 28-1]
MPSRIPTYGQSAAGWNPLNRTKPGVRINELNFFSKAF